MTGANGVVAHLVFDAARVAAAAAAAGGAAASQDDGASSAVETQNTQPAETGAALCEECEWSNPATANDA